MKNCIIVHGSNSTKKGSKEGLPENERHWKPWLKRELEKRGINVSNELYPKDWSPNYEDWKEMFEKNNINNHTVLVGHSAGGAFLIRWLGETKRDIEKLILVSPGKAGKETRNSLSHLYGNKTYKSIGRYSRRGIVVFSSDDDIPAHIGNALSYEKELPAKLIMLSGYGHFTLGDMGTDKFPELLEEILK